MNLTGTWAALSLLASFFDDPAEFFRRLPELPSLLPRFADALPEMPGGALSQEFRDAYDDLFKGTNAAIYIPLWASCCVDGNGCLLDRTTLRAVQTYHRFGYVPKEMDGNPPDFIGQQYRFLCYLIACETRAGDGPAAAEYRRAREAFVSEFTLDTVRVVAAGIREYAHEPLFLRVAGLMTDLAAADGSLDADALALDALRAPGGPDAMACADVLRDGPGAPIPDGEPRTVRSSGRNNCGGKCPVTVTVCDGCVLEVSADCGIGDPEIRPCLRGRAYRQTYLNGRRLRYPMIRRAGRGEGLFRRIDTEAAADWAAAELRRLTERYGPGCRYINYASGVTGMMRPSLFVQRLFNLTGGHLSYYGSYSSINTDVGTTYTYGTSTSGNSPETLLDTKYLILWAHNPVSTIFGTQLRVYLAELKARGVHIVVIDPRRSDSAIALADEWIPIVPSTDGALADAMAWTIWSEGLQDQAFMDRFCLGFDAAHMPEGVPAELNYHDYLFGLADGVEKTPEWAERITGVPAATIRRIAVEYASARPACLLPGLGNQRTGNGEQTARGMIALACMTGNVGISGGGAAGCGMAAEEPFPTFPTGTNAYKGVISCFLWPSAIENGRGMTREKDHIRGMEQLSADIKLICNFAGDTLVNQHSDVNRTTRLLRDTSKCECIVASDVFMTPSVRYADLLLPAPSFLEEDDVNAPWRYGHYLLAGNAAVTPVFGCVSEYAFVAGLAKRLGVFEAWSEGFPDRAAHFRATFERFSAAHPELGLPPLDTFMQGGFTYQNAKPFIAFEAQIRDPEHHPFETPSGRIEIVSAALYALHDPEIPAHPGYLPCREGPADPLRARYPIQLIGYHTKRRCHSFHDNNPLLEEADPQLLWLNPADAADRGIATGDTVRIWNDRGGIRIRCLVTDRVMRGVAALSQGAWYTPDPAAGDGRDPDDIRGNINTLTGFFPTPLAKGNPQHTNLVEVARC